MALNIKQIEAGKSQTAEFMREYSEEVIKTVAAFANTDGGTIYIGVNDDKTIKGVDNPDDILLQAANAVRLNLKPDIAMFVHYAAEKIGKASVITITVQRGTGRPYYLASKGLRPEGVYVRQGPLSAPAAEAVIIKMIKETDGENYEDARSLNQDLTFSAAEKFFKKEGVPFGQSQRKALRLQTADGVYTNLGLLLSDQAEHAIKLAVFEGLEKEVFKDRREFSGSLLSQLQEAYDYLDMRGRSSAETKGLTRQENRDYPEEALREALLNALVHRDYSFSSGILVSVFDDRIEIVSVGGLVKGVSLDDVKLGLSIHRNEKLADVFCRLRLTGACGTGISKIMRSYADCFKKPKLKAAGNAFKITLPNKNVKGWGAGARASSFSANEKIVINLLNGKEVINRKDAEAALEGSQATAVRTLRSLVEKQAIRVIGGGKKTRYAKA